MNALVSWIIGAGFLTLLIAGLIAVFERDSRNKIVTQIAKAIDRVDEPPSTENSAIAWSGLSEFLRVMPQNTDALLRRSASAAALVIAAVLFSYGAAIGIVNEIRKPPALECASPTAAPKTNPVNAKAKSKTKATATPTRSPIGGAASSTSALTAKPTETPRPTPCIMHPPTPSPAPTATEAKPKKTPKPKETPAPTETG